MSTLLDNLAAAAMVALGIIYGLHFRATRRKEEK